VLSDQRTAAQRLAAGTGRTVRAWRALRHEQRLAAYAALGLFVTLFLPWYHETVVAVGSKPQAASASVTGWGAFSFAEAAVLLVAAGVLTLLFQRAEGRAFHLPGGDGAVVMAAGLWTAVLVVWRIFDKQSVDIHGPGTTVSGIEWGIFVALAVACFLAYAGSRIRAAHQPEPPLPGEEDPSAEPEPAGASPAPRPTASERPAPRPAASERPSAPPGPAQRPRPVRPPRPVPAGEPPTRRLAAPSTQAARQRAPAPDEQLTIPLDEGGEG
jgi:hypothetical protein